MLNVRWSKILHDMWLYKARTLLTIAAVAVGVTAIGVTMTTEMVLRRDMDSGYAASRPADAVLILPPFNDRLAKTVVRMPEVQAAEARRVAIAELEIGDGRWLSLELHAISDFESLSVNRLALEPGAVLPPPEGSVLLERSLLHVSEATIGERVQVRTSDGVLHELAVAGLVNDLAPLPSDMNLWAVGYLTPDTLAALLPNEPRDYNRLYLTAAREPGTGAYTRTDVERIVTRVAETVEAYGYPVLYANVPEPGKPILADNINTILIILGTIGVLSPILSAFLIVNVISGLIAHQIPQIGILKALGGRTKQVTRLYLQMVLIFGLVAVLIALPLGIMGAYFLTNLSAQRMDFDVVSFGLPPRTLAFQAFSALVVPVLAALAPIASGARTTIRQAIDRTGLSEGNALISRLLARVKGIPTILNLALRNVFRKWARMLLTLGALALGGAIFIAVLGIRQSVLDAIEEAQQVKNYDVEIHFSALYPSAHIEREVLQQPGVVAVESWRGTDARCVFDDGRISRSFTLIGVPPTTDMTRPSIREGRWLGEGGQNEVFIDADMAALLGGPSIGDEIVLRIGEQEGAWRLVGSTGRMFSPHAFIDRASFERLTGTKGYANRAVVQTERHAPAFQALIEGQLKERFERADMPVSYSWISGPGNEAIAAQLDMVIVILLAMAVLVAVVGGLGLASTMGLNVLERTREIGILRSLGAKSGLVRRMVIMEGLAISFVSFVLAIPLSIPLSLLMGDMVGMEVLMRSLDYTFSWSGTLLWFAIAMIIAFVASLLPANNAAGLTIRETLAYQG
jgi:putative ABC transport system permease protein